MRVLSVSMGMVYLINHQHSRDLVKQYSAQKKRVHHFACTTDGGFQAPSPVGRIEGGCVVGQYRRMTR